MARSCWDEEECAHVKADRSKAAFPEEDPRSPLLYENASAECERVGHPLVLWQLPNGPSKRLCRNCDLTFGLGQTAA